MKKLASFILAAAALTLAAPASAQFSKPEDAIKYRKNSFFVMQQHFARVGAMVSGKVPFDAKAAADNAAVAESMAKLPWAAFGEGTDKGETQAKPEVWKESAKFKEYADKLQTEMGKVVAATKTGKLDNIKAAMGPAGETCKNCHDAYRNR